MPRVVTKADLAVAKKLRTLRIISRTSQEALASAVGTTFQQIQKYETGTNRISVGMLVNIANALNVSISDFFSDDIGQAPECLRNDIKAEALSELDWCAVFLLNEVRDYDSRVRLLHAFGELVSLVTNERNAMGRIRSKIGTGRRASAVTGKEFAGGRHG